MCPTCNGLGFVHDPQTNQGVACPAPDCPDKHLPFGHDAIHLRVTRGVKVVNLAPNQAWSGQPVLFDGEK